VMRLHYCSFTFTTSPLSSYPWPWLDLDLNRSDIANMADSFEKVLSAVIHKTEDCQNTHGCKMWLGGLDRDGYGRKSFTLPDGSTTQESAHRAVFYASHRLLRHQLPRRDRDDNMMDVGHLCHYKLCVKITHLVYETHDKNMNRNHCVLQGMCSGHNPPCLLCKL
jgi:hypothetical protein